MHYVYAISSQTSTYIYVGLTSKLSKRITAHNSGYEKTTELYRPFKLIYTEEYESREAAWKREKYFNSGVGKEFLKTIEF